MSQDKLETLRQAAFAAAYRMLGDLADAEDAAQEALLRLHQADPPPLSPRGWIIAVTTHLCIDRLRSAQVRRETYVGPWLPEPTLSVSDPAAQVELAESVSLGLLLILETLSPTQRAAFLLREVFGYGYSEIAEILQRSEPSCRQMVSRARRAVREGRARYEPDAKQRAAVAGAFFRACSEGSVEDLLAVLAEDAVMRSDGGGVVQASRVPIRGAARCARAIVALRVNNTYEPRILLVSVNGTPGIVIYEDEVPRSLMGVDVADGRVAAVYVLREPTKLAATLATLPVAYGNPVPVGPRSSQGRYAPPDELTLE